TLCCCHLYCSSARFRFWSLPVVLALVVGVIINFPVMASGSGDGMPHSPTRSIPTPTPLGTDSSSSSSRERYTHE
ncbi:hypothetical protein LINPERPRIM_LOCUS22155, partial [Linum perenne]